MPSHKVSFRNSLGYLLSAKIDLPLSKAPYTFALFAHVFTGNKNLHSAKQISMALTSKGIAVMRFDFTGLGESAGDFSDSNFTSNVEDLIAAAEFLKENYSSPSIIIGHSLGGIAALFAAKQILSIDAVVTIGAPSYPSHVTHLLKQNLEEIEENGSALVCIQGREFLIKKQFLDDLRSQNHIRVIKDLRKSLLIMHSPQDSVVSIENAAHIYELAHHPKSFVSLDGADHLLMNKADAYYAGEVIAIWANKYVDMKKREKLETNKEVVVRLENSGYTTEIWAGNHGLLADEPKNQGGEDMGPSPYELLSASLGSCTAMTLQMYARRKNWDLKEVKVHLSHCKKHSHSDDLFQLDSPAGRIDRFERVIELKGDLDENQRNRLLEIANKCPVHKTLQGSKEFATKLKDQPEWHLVQSD